MKIGPESNNERSQDRFVQFMYLLLRDEVTSGKMEKLLERMPPHGMEATFENGYLEEYAINLVDRVLGNE